MLNVSVPSGGSWWEQHTTASGFGGAEQRFQYPLVGRGGSNPDDRLPSDRAALCFSTLWWVVVGATALVVRALTTKLCFSTLWWVVVGATRTRDISSMIICKFQYPLVGRGGSNWQ